MKKIRTILSWSSGKDSAWTLYQLRKMARIDIVALVSTLNEDTGRVAMHGVRRELARDQALAAGLPLWEVALPWPCSNAAYEARMATLIERAKAENVVQFAFGDLWLADIRAYREKQLQGTGITPIFPLWGQEDDTPSLAREMIRAGLKAKLTCHDSRVLGREFAGREFDLDLLADLPPGVDPCGERGEFHTFCHAGPMFSRSLSVETGEIVERDGYVLTDLLPSGRSDRAALAGRFQR